MTCVNNAQKVVCIDIIEEIDYYDQIVDFFDKVQSIKSITSRDIDIWESQTYISLMSDLKTGKNLKNCPIEEAVKRAILLIIQLFDQKEKNYVDIKNLPENEKSDVKDRLKYFI